MQRSTTAEGGGAVFPRGEADPAWLSILMLVVWLAACVVAFLPIAFETSPWDAVTLHVAGHQGNWWHALVGFPFFLAYPMVWLRLGLLRAKWQASAMTRRVIWGLIGLSSMGTIAVETPFLLHLAGTRGWPRLSLLVAGLGILMVCAGLLFVRRRRISPTRACQIALNAAYLANLSLVLIVYSGAPGSVDSRIGWLVSMVLVWPMILELALLFSGSSRMLAADAAA